VFSLLSTVGFKHSDKESYVLPGTSGRPSLQLKIYPDNKGKR